MSRTTFALPNQQNSRLGDLFDLAYFNGFLGVFALQSTAGTFFVDTEGRLIVSTKDTVE